MDHVITEFMWSYQHHFRNGVERDVNDALGSIGVPIDSVVILVGFAEDENLEHPICVEPEIGAIRSDAFSGVADEARQRLADDPESSMIISSRHHHDQRQQLLWRQHRANSVADVIARSGMYESYEFFVSAGTLIGNHEVHTCIGVPRVMLADLPTFEDDVLDRVRVGRSLQHCVIDECLRRADDALNLPHPGDSLYVLGDRDGELERAAARRFVDGCVYRATSMPSDLLHHVNAISSQSYERAAAHGRLLVAPEKVAAELCRVRFAGRVPLSESRAVRKILETTDDSTALVTDGSYVYGLGSATAEDSSVFDVSIVEHATWELAHPLGRLLRVSYGKPVLPKPAINPARFSDVIERTLGEPDVGALWALIEAVRAGGHGTTVVISGDAVDETERLGGQAVTVEPSFLDPTDVEHIARIDGAVLVDPLGFCHAFGVILDGAASGHGSRGRGARYNSAVRYQRSRNAECVLVVISDDGTVDLIPHLRPRVDREMIADVVDRFVGASGEQAVDTNDRFGDALREVRRNSFYFDAEQCDRVNAAYAAEMEWRLRSGGFSVSQTPIEPHPDMSDSYWL